MLFPLNLLTFQRLEMTFAMKLLAEQRKTRMEEEIFYKKMFDILKQPI